MKGNDESIKKYLANKLKSNISMVSELSGKSTQLEQQYLKGQETNE